MNSQSKLDILIECRGCKVENIFGEYTPDKILVCNQCRERLIEPDLNDIYSRFDCQTCGFAILVLKETKFKIGEAKCRCGSNELASSNCSSIIDNARDAGAFNIEEEDSPSDGDWYRSESLQDDDSNYNDMFDQDPGDN